MKKIISLALTLCMMLTFFIPFGVNATTADTVISADASKFTGDATEFEISSAAELLGLAKAINENGFTTAGKTFTLTNHIDLNPSWTVDSGDTATNAWTPISSFAGTLDGQGYEIRGIYCVASEAIVSSNTYIAFINKLEGNVKNLALVNGVIDSTLLTSSSNFIGTGALCGNIGAGVTEISNVYVDIDLKRNISNDYWSYMGGISADCYVSAAPSTTLQLTNIVSVGTRTLDTATTSGIVNNAFIGRIQIQDKGTWNVSMNGCLNYGTLTSSRGTFNVTYNNCHSTLPTVADGVNLVETDEYGIIPAGLKAVLKKAADAPVIVDPDVIVPDVTNFADTSKTEYSIDDAQDLYGLAVAINSGFDTTGKTFVITDDIDLNPNWSVADGKTAKNSWTPISELKGTLDGQGHTVSGLYFVAPEADSDSSGAAHYGFINKLSGTVRNLVLEDGLIDATGETTTDTTPYIVGGLVAQVNTSVDVTVENVFVDIKMVNQNTTGGFAYMGAIIGEAYATAASLDASGTLTVRNTVGNLSEGSEIDVFHSDASRLSPFVGRFQAPSDKYHKIVMSDCMNIFAIGGTKLGDSISGGAGRLSFTQTRCYGGGATADGIYFVNTDKGVLPLILADMLTPYWIQSTTPDADGKYSIRIAAEISTTAWSSVGFTVECVGKENKASNVDNKLIYETVYADSVPVSADGLAFMKGTYIYVIVLDGLEAGTDYELKVTSTWTKDSTVFTSAVAKTCTYNINAAS